MQQKAQLYVTDLRRAVRHPVNYATTASHPARGEMRLRLRNVSANGCMAEGNELSRGERLMVHLPVVGRLEGCCMWVHEDRIGLQFERIIRLDDLARMIAAMQPERKLRQVR